MEGGGRQSLGAGLLLGLALGCSWLAHRVPQLTVRVVLIIGAGLLTLMAAALILSLGGGRGGSLRWRQRLEAPFASAGIPFFALLVILAVGAITSGNNLLYLLVSGLLAALAVSGLVAALNLSGMVLRFRLPDEIFAGQPATVAFTLSNDKGFWPAYSLTVQASADPEDHDSQSAEMEPIYFAYVARRQSFTAESTIIFPYRGTYAATAFALNTRFPFGLLNQRRRFQSSEREQPTLVYPKPLAVPPVAFEHLRAGRELAREGRGDSLELYRIRPLQTGDSARHVYWKASARAGTLQIREFSREQASRLRLRLALPPGSDPAIVEPALGLCAGWLLAAERADCWLEFLGENAPGLWLPPAPARRHHSLVLDYLARVNAAAGWVRPAGAALDPDVVEFCIDGAGAVPLVKDQ
ncbi:MAG TPA: DUF58 domain-containing protein [Terriglobales bacterium]